MVFPAPLDPTIAITSPARAMREISRKIGVSAIVSKTYAIEFHVARKGRQRGHPWLDGRLSRAADVFKNFGRRAKRQLELLVDSAQPLYGLVGFEQRVNERDENSRRHRSGLDLHASVHQH